MASNTVYKIQVRINDSTDDDKVEMIILRCSYIIDVDIDDNIKSEFKVISTLTDHHIDNGEYNPYSFETLVNANKRCSMNILLLKTLERRYEESGNIADSICIMLYGLKAKISKDDFNTYYSHDYVLIGHTDLPPDDNNVGDYYVMNNSEDYKNTEAYNEFRVDSIQKDHLLLVNHLGITDNTLSE